ncbi:hypothetical protein MMC28_007415 [Mycoblastus sanguinarius]|nr:hypothetical protein [Mycoblastus sanguinarius]
MGRHSTAIVAEVTTQPQSPSKKRKRDQSPTAEIEVDVTAPEPPSKKALRKAKKAKSTLTAPQSDLSAVTTESALEDDVEVPATTAAPKRSEYGIWIGNLPWTATKNDLRSFLTKDTEITDDMITRLHMPASSDAAVAASRQRVKPQNKGFAYVDFSTNAALAEALALSEILLTGRRVLIKDSKSFEGRPEKPKGEDTATGDNGKSPSKRVFVGNLKFETTKEDVREHFARCGEVLDVFLATFEDSGKCKGYGWVEFAELEAGEAAVRGWVNYDEKAELENVDEEDKDAEVVVDDAKPKKKPRLRKWWVNKLQGRPLRMEFAEDKAVRYKKRYGKDGSARNGEGGNDPDSLSMAQPVDGGRTPASHDSAAKHFNKKATRKVDARTIKPGAALAAAPRLTGGIVESQGKKTTFA